MEVKQLRSQDGTGTLSYLLADPHARVGILIDPNREDIAALRPMIDENGLRLTHIIDTHTHADHVSAAELSKAYGARVVMHENTKNKWKIVDQGDRFGIGDILRANAAIHVDQFVKDGETISSGDMTITMLFTPGHTDNHLSLLVGENLFTGDLLLIGQAGRSDLPGGNPAEQYESLFNKILPLPDSMTIHPGHDYAGNVNSSLGEEKKSNPFLQNRSKEEYIEFVKDFFPPIAESVGEGGKMTLQCGTTRVPQKEGSATTVTAEEFSVMEREGMVLVDVREPAELAVIGFIEGAINIPVGQLARRIGELPARKETPVVVVCQSGSRSREAAHFLQSQGYSAVKDLAGGTAAWIKSGRPVVRREATLNATRS